MSDIRPFKIDVPQTKLDSIYGRLKSYQPFPAPANEVGFAYGMSTPVLQEIIQYWTEAYDWRKAEAELNQFPQYLVEIDGIDVHFVHILGESGGSRPLLLTHGWPGSMFEFWDAAERLAFPSKHGGIAEDAFNLVIPSLPGYAFSGKPPSPIGPKTTARLWESLMADVLGYDTYLAQGGDWGGMVTSFLGLNHSHHDGKGGCRGIHLNMIGFRPTPATPLNDAEVNWLTASQSAMQAEGAYFMEQATKPQTLAIALMDSPVGTAAWILEKFHGWSDLQGGTLTDTYTRDQLITNVMLYLVNDAIATSVWYYNGFFQEGANALPENIRCETPTGFSNFPGETIYTPPPRSWCDRAYNIVHWTDMPRGGHFAAMEQPELFVDDVRLWARSLS